MYRATLNVRRLKVSRCIQNYLVHTNPSGPLNIYSSHGLHWVLSRCLCARHRASISHTVRSKSIMVYRLFCSENKEPLTPETEVEKDIGQTEPSRDGEQSGITNLGGDETKPEDPVTLKDYDLNQLLKNIQEAQLHDALFPSEEETRRREVRTSPMTIDELVEFLREEGAEDICVINVPPEREYVKYFVTCTGQGVRHIGRMADSLVAELKRVKDERGLRKVMVEGRDCEDWMVVHLGNTVVHFMTGESRRMYELEKLWMLGHHYDDQYRELERTVLGSENRR